MSDQRSTVRTSVFAYLVMSVFTLGGFFLVKSLGVGLAAPIQTAGLPTFGTHRPTADPGVTTHVLLALVAVILVARGLGELFRRISQPPVIGEILAGIALGPSLLGRVAPDAYHVILPASVAPYLGVIAQVGVILYMFIVGIELDTTVLRKRSHESLTISHASIVLPFVLGGVLSLLLYPMVSTRDVPFTVFALFMGVAMSITAFPVLARILTDRKMHRSELGVMALTCAAINDVTAWCLLAMVVGVVQSRAGTALMTVGLTAVFVLAMITLVRPLVLRVVRAHAERDAEIGQGEMALVCVGLLLSSLATEFIGIHALFGAFLLGALIPHDSLFARQVITRLHDVVVVLFLPAFFAFTGMRTQIGLVSGSTHWLLCGLIILVASVGKFGGTLLAARWNGLDWRRSTALGVLMNTRGLMELIVLNVGVDLGVLSPVLFTMMVLMAVVTTLATSPLIALLTRGESLDAQKRVNVPV